MSCGGSTATPTPAGSGAVACASSRQSCDGVCVDLQTDPRNCGECDVACPEGDVCTSGACALFCGGGATKCGNQCVDLRDDPSHCGACEASCGPNAACVNAQCALLAGEDATSPLPRGDASPDANGANTANTEADAAHPEADAAQPETDARAGDAGGGGADASCPAMCGTACVDTAIDVANCGACSSPCAAGSVCTNGMCAATSSNWNTFGHDAQHSGENPDETGVPPPSDSWSVPVFTSGLSPAVAENGRVFVTGQSSFNTDAPLVALSASDGSPLWTYNFGSVFSVGHPSVANGAVYVQTVGSSENCYLWSFDAATGNTLWTAGFPSQWVNFWAPMTYGSTVYINGGEYGGLYGFNAADGAQIFFNGSIGQYDSWSPAYFGGAVYSFVDGTFQANDPATGTAVWSTSIPWNWTGYSMNTSPAFSSSMAYVISPPNLVAVDPSTRTVAWSANGSFSGTPAVADGVVYATNGGSLVARDAASGDLLWTFVGDQSLSYPPAVANGYVYVSSANSVYAVQISTHQQVWTAPGGGWVTLAAGRLLVAGADGTLRGFVLSTP